MCKKVQNMVDIIYQLFSFFFPLIIVGILILGVYLRGKSKNRAIKDAVLPNLKKVLKPYVTSPLDENQQSANEWAFELQPKPITNLSQLNVTIQLTQRQVFFALLSNRLLGNQDFLIFEGIFARGTRGFVLEIIPKKERKLIEKNYKYLVELEDLNLGGSKKLEEVFMQKGDNPNRARRILGDRDLLTRLLKAENELLWLTINKEAPHLRGVFRINDDLDVENASKFVLDLATRFKSG